MLSVRASYVLGPLQLLIRPAQLKGAKVIWPDVDLTDKPPAKEGGRPRRDSGERQFKSGAFEAIHEAAAALHKVGAIDAAAMREFDPAALLKKVRGRSPMGNPNASINVSSRIKTKLHGKARASENPVMKSRHKKGGKRRYITARDVLADIPPSAVARRLTVQPKVTDAKRLRSKAPAPGRRKSPIAEFSATLGVFLDDWEKEHGPFTSVELDRAAKELRTRD